MRKFLQYILSIANGGRSHISERPKQDIPQQQSQQPSRHALSLYYYPALPFQLVRRDSLPNYNHSTLKYNPLFDGRPYLKK